MSTALAASRSLDELAAVQAKLDAVAKKFKNCIQAVEAGGTEILGGELRERAVQLRAEKDALLVERERKRQQVEACDATKLSESRIREALERLSETLPKLEPSARKEFVRLFVEKVEVSKRFHRPKSGESSEPARQMEVRICLHVPRLVEGMTEKSWSETRGQRVIGTTHGMALESRVDFTHAHRGEVTIVAPFTQVVSFGSGARPGPKPGPAPAEQRHIIHRARKWQQLLDSGKACNRSALAAQNGITPAAVTRILKLNEVIPEIQDYLASLKTPQPGKHFPLKRVGQLANLSPEKQRSAFKRMQQKFAVSLA